MKKSNRLGGGLKWVGLVNNKRKTIIGRQGEELAVKYLSEQGVRVIGRNIRSAYGEIDIIGLVQDALVFFEVRTRTSDSLGFPEDSITARKKEHMVAAAEAFILANPGMKNQWRIDVLAIQWKPNSQPQIEWFENAV